MAKEDHVRAMEAYFVKRFEDDWFWRFSHPANLLSNGDFESWTGGTAVPPDGWTLTGTGSVARTATSKICTYAAEVTYSQTDSYLEQELTCYDHLQGLHVSFSCWVRATVADRVRLGIDDGVGQSFSEYHPGDSTFIFLTVTRLVDTAATKLEVRCQVDTAATSGIFDGAILVVGPVPRAYACKPLCDEGTISIADGTLIKDVLAGDPRNIYRIAGVDMAVTGVDDDDGNKFKIAMGTDVLGTAADALVIDTSLGVYINDNANADMTIGLTVNQGANDDEIMALKSSDVAHGATDIAETDTYGAFQKSIASGGGVHLIGLKDADGIGARAINIEGLIAEDADTTKTTTGRAITELLAAQLTGTGYDNIVADGNAFGLRVYRGGSYKTALLIDEDGDVFMPDGGSSTILFIGDVSSNADMTRGLTIDQLGSDDEIIALKSSDVAHGGTTLAETDTYVAVRKSEAAAGGASIWGLKDSGGVAGQAADLRGYLAENADTTKTTAGRAIVETTGAQISGTGVANVIANGNVFIARGYRGGAFRALFIVDEDGDLYADGGVASTDMVTLYDEYDDAHLVRAFDLARSRGRGAVRSRFDEFLKYDESKLVELGILGDRVENGGLVNVTRLQQLLCGGVWQLYTRLEDTLERLAVAENKLKLLEAN